MPASNHGPEAQVYRAASPNPPRRRLRPPQRAAALLVALAVEDVENGEKTRKDVDFLRKNGLKW